MKWPEAQKRLVWAVCCVCCNGSFRIHEILSKKKKEFGPLCTLLEKLYVPKKIGSKLPISGGQETCPFLEQKRWDCYTGR